MFRELQKKYQKVVHHMCDGYDQCKNSKYSGEVGGAPVKFCVGVPDNYRDDLGYVF